MQTAWIVGENKNIKEQGSVWVVQATPSTSNLYRYIFLLFCLVLQIVNARKSLSKQGQVSNIRTSSLSWELLIPKKPNKLLHFEGPGFGDDSEPNRSFLKCLGHGELIFLYCYLCI